MKKISKSFLVLLMIFMLVLGIIPEKVVVAQEGTETTTPTVTETPTPTNTPTNTPITPTYPPAPTSIAPSFSRPLVVINAYSYGEDAVTPGSDFTLKLRVKNNGGSQAYNIVATFESTEFLPLESGGVRTVSFLGSGDATDISQPLRASATLWGMVSGVVVVNMTYTDSQGTPYTEKFTITINLRQANYSAAAATATPTTRPRAQLVVGGYEVDVDPLQPGSIFNLKVNVRNLGSVDAQSVTMVLGGGVSSSDGSGTPTSGLSGGSPELTTFAPIGSSNLIYLDKVMAGEPKDAEAQLIVNVSAIPGAYPFKISFVYSDANGNRVVDDQVITLLVYSLPKVEIGFYLDPGILIAGQPTNLPIQITNLGKTTAILGNLRVTSDGADITNNVALVGPLEQGGYFTLDAMAMPYMEGPLDITISVSYTDDFNQPRMVEQILNVQVEPIPVYEENPDEGFETPILEQPETFLQKIIRFFKGMFGLGSGKPVSPDNGIPAIEGDIPQEEIPVKPMPSGKG